MRLAGSVEWDEGPDVGGTVVWPYRQSERKALYKDELEKLIASGKAYYAFDTPEELAAARNESEQKGEVFKYSAHNRRKFRNAVSLSKEELENEINKGERSCSSKSNRWRDNRCER